MEKPTKQAQVRMITQAEELIEKAGYYVDRDDGLIPCDGYEPEHLPDEEDAPRCVPTVIADPPAPNEAARAFIDAFAAELEADPTRTDGLKDFTVQEQWQDGLLSVELALELERTRAWRWATEFKGRTNDEKRLTVGIVDRVTIVPYAYTRFKEIRDKAREMVGFKEAFARLRHVSLEGGEGVDDLYSIVVVRERPGLADDAEEFCI